MVRKFNVKFSPRQPKASVWLSKDEQRIIENLRKAAKLVDHGSFDVEFTVHDGQVVKGQTGKMELRI